MAQEINLSLSGYVDSHFKLPHEILQAYDPWTPQMDQETIDYRTEQLIYHNIDATLALVAFGVHAYHVGGFAATNTIHMYRFMSAIRAIPVVAAMYGVVGSVLLQAEAMQEFTPQEQLAILSGVPQPGSSQKQKLMTLSGL